MAPGTPRRWLEPGQIIELKNAATIYGKLSYVLRHGDEPNTIHASIHLPMQNKPEKVWLFVRAPFNRPIRSVEINGQEWNKWDQEKETILIPNGIQNLNVVIKY